MRGCTCLSVLGRINSDVLVTSYDLLKRDVAEYENAEFYYQVLAELTKIRQICCDPSLLLEKYDGESAKREACIDLIRSAIEGKHKMLIFSQFTSMLELLEKDMADEILNGETGGIVNMSKQELLELIQV